MVDVDGNFVGKNEKFGLFLPWCLITQFVLRILFVLFISDNENIFMANSFYYIINNNIL